VVRGDDQLNEAKLQTATGAQVLRPAHPEEIQKWMGARPGSLGGVGISKARVYLDRRLAGLSGLVTGANKDGFHVRNVSVARDLSHATPADLRTVSAGEGCPRCGKPLAVGKALEVGHIFKLGTRYSESMGARVLDEAGKEVPIVMGSYGIGVERILAAAVELHHDADGIRWPMSVAARPRWTWSRWARWWRARARRWRRAEGGSRGEGTRPHRRGARRAGPRRGGGAGGSSRRPRRDVQGGPGAVRRPRAGRGRGGPA